MMNLLREKVNTMISIEQFKDFDMVEKEVI